jgi:serine/threonine protein kinase/Tfp pilus assembly protein PilF
MPSCPSPEQLQLLLCEGATLPEVHGIEAHLQNCGACQAALERMIGSAELSRRAPSAAATVAEFLRRLEQDPLTKVPYRPAGPPPTETWDSTVAPDDMARLPSVEPTGERYTRTRIHARGGIGQVWLARDADLGREVALKELLPEHSDNRALWLRFLEEARVTGQLEHPAIVPVYELGRRTTDGKPFYTMRFVRGRTLSEAIAAYHTQRTAGTAGPLELRELLGAFVAVCNALAYAHARGVLHRDLKGSNVILGAFGEVIVLDWGLAKRVGGGQWAVGSKDKDVGGQRSEVGEAVPSALPTAHCPPPTVQGQVLGTPGYMAPEQAEGRPDRIDARTDVYGLGAILYEILTGRPPFVGKDTHDVLRRVCSEAPVPPRRMNRRTPAALEAICLKALAKAPGDRYSSAGALAQEVQRWLADEPVTAYREPLRARLGRWLRRHPAAAAGTTALLLAGLVGLAGGLAAVRAEQQRTLAERDRAEQNAASARSSERRAEAVSQFLVNDLLAQATPERNEHEKKVTVEEVLNRAAGKVGMGLAGQPDVEATIRYAIGRTYWRLGNHKEARPQLERALALRKEFLEPDHPETLVAQNALALVLQDEGKLAEAEVLVRECLSGQRRVRGPDHPETLAVLNNLAALLSDEGKLAEAETLYRQNFDAFLRVRGPEHPDTLTALDNLAEVLQTEGKLTEAEPLCRKSLDAQRRVRGLDHPDTLTAENNLGALLLRLGRPTEAEPLLRRNLEARRRVLGAEHPDALFTTNNLAGALREQNRLAEALALYRANADVFRRVQGPEHPDTLGAVYNLAGVLRQQGKLGEAEPLARENLKRQRKVLPAGHPSLANGLALVGWILIDTGRAREAEPLLREAVAISRTALPSRHPQTAQAESLLGGCLTALGQYAESEPLLVHAYDNLQAATGTPAKRTDEARERIVHLYESWGRAAEAMRWRTKQGR